jgi:sulfur relay (sulfurtransferase) complex TusBCD TusD component (DsrE family)
MNFYNSFTPLERAMCGRWAQHMRSIGLWVMTPEVCVACGQDRGVIDGHVEDYSSRFGTRAENETG